MKLSSQLKPFLKELITQHDCIDDVDHFLLKKVNVRIIKVVNIEN